MAKSKYYPMQKIKIRLKLTENCSIAMKLLYEEYENIILTGTLVAYDIKTYTLELEDGSRFKLEKGKGVNEFKDYTIEVIYTVKDIVKKVKDEREKVRY